MFGLRAPNGPRDAKVRTWDDVPWAEHPVTLRYSLRRLWCRRAAEQWLAALSVVTRKLRGQQRHYNDTRCDSARPKCAERPITALPGHQALID